MGEKIATTSTLHHLAHARVHARFSKAARPRRRGERFGWCARSQAGDVDLARFAREAIWQAAHGSLPLVRAAFEGELALADARAESFLVNHVANRASRTQGRTFLAACARIFDDAAVLGLAARARTREVSAHLAPVFGAAMVTILAYVVTTLHPGGSDTWRTVSLFIAGAAALLAPATDDPPSTVLHARCQLLKDAPPPAGWDGVHVALSK